MTANRLWALSLVAVAYLTMFSSASEAQQPVIGFLNSASAAAFTHLVGAYRKGLEQAGYAEGKNMRIEYRWAENRTERLPDLANDLVQQKVAVITAAGGTVSAKAAKTATSTIPVVFVIGDDPVQFELVKSMSRPGGNVTGVTVIASQLEAKRLELMKNVVPDANIIAMLVNSSNPNSAGQIKEAQEAAQILGQQLVVVSVPGDSDLKVAFSTIVDKHAKGLLVNADPVFNSRRTEIATLTIQHSLPAVFEWREFVAAGGLMSFGTSIADAYQQAGVYTGRILKGASPAELPVAEPTKFELVINLKAAKALGVSFSPELLARADDVLH